MPILILTLGVFFYIYCEISLLISVGSAIGVLPLILVMIAISALGLWLLKLRGLLTVLQIRQQLAQGQLPTQAVISSVFFAIAGVLFLIPGFLSDILALLLLLPFTRTFIQNKVMKAFASKVTFRTFNEPRHSARSSATTFDAEFEHKQDEDKWIK